jgi:hypothetical protein
MQSALLCADDYEVTRQYSQLGWKQIKYWKTLSEGLAGELDLQADEATIEQLHPIDEITELLVLDGITGVIDGVRQLRGKITEANGGDSIVHFYEEKTWRSVEYWKAQAQGFDNPYKHRTIRIQTSSAN